MKIVIIIRISYIYNFLQLFNGNIRVDNPFLLSLFRRRDRLIDFFIVSLKLHETFSVFTLVRSRTCVFQITCKLIIIKDIR